jgi:hypothetical protein
MATKLKDFYRFLSPRFQTIHLNYPVDAVPRYSKQHPIPVLNEAVVSGNERYASLLERFKHYAADFAAWKYEQENPQTPYWNNSFFPGLDIISLYSIIAEYKPKRYMEVGSGNSTKVAFSAKKKHSPQTKITSVDPMPRAEIDQLADEVIRQPLEKTDLSVFSTLEKGDILFIDNSHRCLPNSDVTVVFLEILPQLKPGVIVHVHDIYLPYDYPQFMTERFYNEQYVLGAMIAANPQRYKTLLPCFYVSENAELAAKLNPVWQTLDSRIEKHGGSYWLEIG